MVIGGHWWPRVVIGGPGWMLVEAGGPATDSDHHVGGSGVPCPIVDECVAGTAGRLRRPPVAPWATVQNDRRIPTMH